MTVAPDTLRQFDLFKEFSDEELAEIASFCRKEGCGHNDQLFSEGDSADRLYLILKGKISLEKEVRLGRSGSSRQATVSTRGAGSTIGWSCLVKPHIYTMTAVCIEPTELLVIEGNDLRRFMSHDPEGRLKLMTAVAGVVRGRMEDTTSTLMYFLSIIAHELKSPMAAIENYLEVMLGGFAGEFTSKQQRMLERSALRLKDLRNLINDILDLARMQPEHIRADFDPNRRLVLPSLRLHGSRPGRVVARSISAQH